MDSPTDLVPIEPETITLSDGRKIRISEPTMFEIADATKLLSGDMREWFEEKNLFQSLAVLLWLCSRGDGLTVEEKVARRWKVDLDTFLASLSPRDVKSNADVMLRFFGNAFGLTGLAAKAEGSSSELSESGSPTETAS